MPTPSGRLPRLPPGRQTLPRDLVASHQRERIVTATVELIGEHGYHETTLEQITKRARIAWATLYQNFATKEDCYLAAFDQVIEGAAQALARASEEESWAERVTLSIDILVGLVADEPARARFCLIEFQSAGPQARARFEALIERLAAGLRQGRELIPAARRPARLEESIVGGIAWLVQSSLVDGDTDRIRALLPEMLQISLTPYIGEDEANRRALAARPRR